MYIIKNAMKSITRSMGRNLLIGLIILIVTVSSVVALSIRNSAMDIVAFQEEEFQITSNLNVDRNKLRADYEGSNENMRALMERVPVISIGELLDFADSDYVKSVDYDLTVQLNGFNIVAAGDIEDFAEGESPLDEKEMQGTNHLIKGDFSVVGYSKPEEISGFITGEYQMVSGSVFSLNESLMQVLISNELAEINDLKLGDNISLFNSQREEETYEVTIAGIYIDNMIDAENNVSLFSNSANQIISTYDLVSTIWENSLISDETKLTAQLHHTFFLWDSGTAGLFREELSDKGLDSYYTMNTNISAFEKAMQPLTNLLKFTSVFLWLTLLVGGVILLVINMINIRERKYEIGVLRAIGMKKASVITQFLIEMLVVTVIAITFGSFAGSALSIPTANYMLENEINQITAEREAIDTNLGRVNGMGSRNNSQEDMQDTDFITEINPTIDNGVIARVAVIGMAIVLLGSLISIVTVSRYEPLKILSSRT